MILSIGLLAMVAGAVAFSEDAEATTIYPTARYYDGTVACQWWMGSYQDIRISDGKQVTSSFSDELWWLYPGCSDSVMTHLYYDITWDCSGYYIYHPSGAAFSGRFVTQHAVSPAVNCFSLGAGAKHFGVADGRTSGMQYTSVN